MRIAIAGIHNEAASFSRHSAGHDAFRWDSGDDILARYGIDRELQDSDGVEFVPVLVVMGGATGLVQRPVFDEALARVSEGLKAAGQLDGVYLHMHGAVGVEGLEGAEEIFVGEVRQIVGPEVLIGMAMDPHGNLSEELIRLVDVTCVHRHSPHIDTHLTPGRTVGHMVRAIRTGIRPSVAWVRVPVLLPGERTSTFVEPGHTVFGAVETAIAAHGVDDAGLWVGFAWADEPRNAAAAIAFGPDADAARTCAEQLARSYWEAREDFAIVSDHYGSWSEALDFLMSGASVPLFISDSGDNVTAGSTGDITYALAETLARPDVIASDKRILFTGFNDPAALDAAIAAGKGMRLVFSLGAWMDDRYSPGVEKEWLVETLIEGQPGEGMVGALLSAGGISVIVQRTRQRFVKHDDPTVTQSGLPYAALIDVSSYDAVVVKNGYLFPSQVEASGSAFMALTPGGTDLDFDRLEFLRRARPLFPFERDFMPDLSAKIVAGPGVHRDGAK
jgi:microcystin degradation protein MlrC